MPTFEYRCRECGKRSTILKNGEASPTMKIEHRDQDKEHCMGTFDRVWSGFGVGRIDGAGDTPGRSSNG